MSDKPKFERALAISSAKQILAGFVCERVIIAGSLRRLKPLVGDIEIVYIPSFQTGPDPSDLFAQRTVNLSDQSIVQMIKSGLLRQRANSAGIMTWGEKNKLAVHVASGIPVDFFATTERAWWNYTVCRTGGAANNVIIAGSAKKKGWQWHPYDSGFTDGEGNWHHATSEEDVYRLAGLPYLEPHERL